MVLEISFTFLVLMSPISFPFATPMDRWLVNITYNLHFSYNLAMHFFIFGFSWNFICFLGKKPEKKIDQWSHFSLYEFFHVLLCYVADLILNLIPVYPWYKMKWKGLQLVSKYTSLQFWLWWLVVCTNLMLILLLVMQDGPAKAREMLGEDMAW